MSRNSNKKIGWVIDYPLYRSGGHKTWFDYINALVHAGYQVDVYIKTHASDSPERLKQVVGEYLIPTEANIIPGWNIKGRYDLLFATWFKTAKIVSDYPYAAKKAYFVQEFEAYLNMMGDDYLEAEDSYRLGLEAVTMGNWLAEMLARDFGSKTHPLFLGSDHTNYYPKDYERENKIAFIYQPEKPRRCPRLVVEALEIIHKVRPDIKLVTYGSKDAPPLKAVDHKEVMGLNDLSELYNTAKVGVALSSSNPSRIAFEMMACGLPVVELYRENNIYDIPDSGAILARQTAEDIAYSAIKLVENENLWAELHAGGIKFMQEHTLEKSLDEFLAIADKLITGRRTRRTVIKPLYNNPIAIASKDFLEKNRYYLESIRMLQNRAIDYSSSVHTQNPALTKLKKIVTKVIGRLAPYIKLGLKIAKSPFTLIKAVRKRIIDLLKKIKLRIGAVIESIRIPLLGIRTYKLASSDIFDTLLRRLCHPDEVKLRAAYVLYLEFYESVSNLSIVDIYYERIAVENELGKKAMIDGFDFEYTLEDVYHSLIKRFVVDISNEEISKHAKKLVEYEIEHEKLVTYRDEKGLKAFSNVSAEEKLLLTDFYMNKDQVREILLANELRDYRIISSADSKFNKISSNAYKKLHKQKKISAKQHFHMGDNNVSDIAAAKKVGVRTLRHINYKEERKKQKNAKQLQSRLEKHFPFQDLIASELSKLSAPNEYTKQQQKLFDAGKDYAPIFFFFVLHNLEKAKMLGLEKIYYLTREGIFFHDIHKIIKANNPLPFQVAEADLLEVSRLATFAPSIHGFDHASFASRLWRQYRFQSVNTFFKSLDLGIDEFLNYLEKYEIDPEEELDTHKDIRLKNLFADKRFQNKLESRIQIKQELFEKYLREKGVQPRSKSDLLICDIGWRGSIHDNLGYMMPDKKIYGLYFALQPLLNPQLDNVFKTAYGPNEHTEGEDLWRYLTAVTFLEMLTNSPTGSTIGYEDTDSGIQAIKKHSDSENGVHAEYIQYFQEGVKQSISSLARIVEVYGISSSEARPFVLELLEKYTKEPHYPLTEAYFGLVHNNTFGEGNFIEMNKRAKFSWFDLALSFISKKKRREFMHKANNSMWIHGYWVYNDKTGLINDTYLTMLKIRPKLSKLKSTLKAVVKEFKSGGNA